MADSDDDGPEFTNLSYWIGDVFIIMTVPDEPADPAETAEIVRDIVEVLKGVGARKEKRVGVVEGFNPDYIDSTVCPKCQRRSFNPGDIEHKFCAACDEFYDGSKRGLGGVKL